MLSTDKVRFLSDTVATCGPSMSAGAMKQAWIAVNVVLAFGGRRFGRNPACAHRLRPDGTTARSPTEVAGIMMDHFANIEGADMVDPVSIVHKHTVTIPRAYSFTTRQLDNVMTERTLAASFAQSAPRAPGPDGIGNENVQECPQDQADFVYPLVFQIQLHAEEPVALNGGQAVDIVKQLVFPAHPASFRRILLENDLAKHHHKWITSRLVNITHLLIKYSQCGGLCKRGADLAALIVRVFGTCTTHANMTTAIL